MRVHKKAGVIYDCVWKSTIKLYIGCLKSIEHYYIL